MLVLSRNEEGAVNIGSDIKVKVLSIKKNSVKLGVEAPLSVRVWRDELPAQMEAPIEQSLDARKSSEVRVVLVVEDDPGHAKLIRKALCQQEGTQVTVAGTARNALDQLGAHASDPGDITPPDLVLLDLNLPDGSGLDLLRTIRTVPELRITPVVVLSCSDDEAHVKQCIELGANAYVSKSAGYEDFRAQVSRIGQFWAGDCLTRRSFSRAPDINPGVLAQETATYSADRMPEEEANAVPGKRILVADDDPGHITLIKRALRRGAIDCAVDAVGNGIEVINYLFAKTDTANPDRTAMPDLILLDLNMPQMNGRQVLQTLRNVHSQQQTNLPPVVVLTSSEEESDISESYKLGAQSFIRKPVDHGRFAVAVQQTTQYWLGLNDPGNYVAKPSRVPR